MSRTGLGTYCSCVSVSVTNRAMSSSESWALLGGEGRRGEERRGEKRREEKRREKKNDIMKEKDEKRKEKKPSEENKGTRRGN